MDIDPLPASPALSLITLAASQAMEFHSPASLSWFAWCVIIIIAAVCLMLSAFVSGSEIAYFGLDAGEVSDLEEDESPEAARAVNLLKNSERLLATILISNNLVNITMVVLMTFAINQVVTFNSGLLNFLVQTVFLTFLLLLFGEIFPKLVARGRTMKWVITTSKAVTLLYNLTGPLARVLVKSTTLMNRIVTRKDEEISTDDLEKALEISDLKEGQDKEMLEGILSFGEKEAGDIMISRVDVTAIEYHAPWDEAMKIIVESGYSRIPVYDTSQDAIRGILFAKDLLPYIGKRDNSFRWQTLLREPFFVPESRMIDDLMEDFRRRRMHIAIVVDEYGGTRGIVTLEDIIEEIVGEIDDEYDENSSNVRRVAPDTFIMEARISISDFCRAVGIEEEALGDIGEAETLAGLLLEIKGDFPAPREILTRCNLTFQVLKMEKHRIMKVKVVVKPEEESATDAPNSKEKD